MTKLLAPEKLLWFYRGYTIKEDTLYGEPVALVSCGCIGHLIAGNKYQMSPLCPTHELDTRTI